MKIDKELLIEYAKKGLTCREIAEKFGVTHQGISIALIRSVGENYRKIYPITIKNPKIIKNCPRCSKEFKVNKSMSHLIHCSRECYKFTPEEKKKSNTERHARYRATESGRQITNEAVYRSIDKHWYKQKARLKLNYHVKKGNILKPDICTVCKENKKLEAHHEDYTKPLDVVWCCRTCHNTLDKNTHNNV